VSVGNETKESKQALHFGHSQIWQACLSLQYSDLSGAQVEQVVEKTIDQTRGAWDNYFSLMQKAFSCYPGTTELAEKMNRYTAQNISAAQEFVQKLSQAKDFQDIIRIQTEFMQTQFSVCALGSHRTQRTVNI